MMTIKLDVERNTPLAIADALISREIEGAHEEYTVIVAKENIRQMGQALINHAEACDRVNKELINY